MGEVVRPRADTYKGTFHQWLTSGVSVMRMCPTICIHMCSVSRVSCQAASGNSGQASIVIAKAPPSVRFNFHMACHRDGVSSRLRDANCRLFGRLFTEEGFYAGTIQHDDGANADGGSPGDIKAAECGDNKGECQAAALAEATRSKKRQKRSCGAHAERNGHEGEKDPCNSTRIHLGRSHLFCLHCTQEHGAEQSEK